MQYDIVPVLPSCKIISYAEVENTTVMAHTICTLLPACVSNNLLLDFSLTCGGNRALD